VAENGIQIAACLRRSVYVGGIGRGDYQMLIPAGQKIVLQIPIGLFQAPDPGHTQAFYQPFLRSGEAAFHAPFGLR